VGMAIERTFRDFVEASYVVGAVPMQEFFVDGFAFGMKADGAVTLMMACHGNCLRRARGFWLRLGAVRL